MFGEKNVIFLICTWSENQMLSSLGYSSAGTACFVCERKDMVEIRSMRYMSSSFIYLQIIKSLQSVT